MLIEADEARDLQRRLDFLDWLEKVRDFGEACCRMARCDPEAAVANLMSYACVSCMPVLLHYEGIVEGLADRLEEIKSRD